VLLQRQSPYQHRVQFCDDLQDVFRKELQSLQVASHLLHDDVLFQAAQTNTVNVFGTLGTRW